MLLTNRSTAAAAASVYRRLRRTYPTWDRLVAAPIGDVRAILRPLGLQWLRSRQIRALLRRVRSRFGSCTLDPLRALEPANARAILESLPGVSTKVAKCVQLYTLGTNVLPVDIHVFRISSRLGLLSKCRPALSHDALEEVIPPPLRYAFHVTCVAHGRAVCRARPRCDECCIRQLCVFGGERA